MALTLSPPLPMTSPHLWAGMEKVISPPGGPQLPWPRPRPRPPGGIPEPEPGGPWENKVVFFSSRTQQHHAAKPEEDATARCTYPLASFLTGANALKEVSDDGRCMLTLVRWSHYVGDLIRARTIICRDHNRTRL